MSSKDYLIYKDQAVELYQGDNSVILPLLLEERGLCVNLCFTDVPYNISDLAMHKSGKTQARLPKGYSHKMRKLDLMPDMFNGEIEVVKGKSGGQTINRNMGEWDKEKWQPEPFLKNIHPIIHPGGQLVAFTSEMLLGGWMETFMDHRGLIFWKKANPTPALPRMYQRPIEIAVWQTKGSNWTFNGRGLTLPIYEFPTITGRGSKWEPRVHPTQKPLALARAILALHASPGQVVIDPFCGSGTFVRAAKDLGMTAIGIEREPRYAAFSAARMRQEVLPIDWSQWEDILLDDEDIEAYDKMYEEEEIDAGV